jgi:hypothetical protein
MNYLTTAELGLEELSALRESPVMDELAEDPGPRIFRFNSFHE